MVLPLRYNLRNVLVRWRSTTSTIVGIALVVTVFVLLQALGRGIEASSGNTGDPRNVLVVRKGSMAESGSIVTLDQYRALRYFEEIGQSPDGQPLISAELVMVVSVPRRAGVGEANTLLRGITAQGQALRPQVTLVDGRWFRPGHREVTVARRLAQRFAGFEIGGSFKAGPDRLTVVGHFDATGSAFDSESWMDADEARAIFDRGEMYSSLLVRPRDATALSAFTNRIAQDRRLALRAESERGYYEKQTATAIPFRILAGLMGTAMSVGAIFAAMNTMYASVASRTREVGTLRVLGYPQGAVVVCFLLEGMLLAALGGALGCAVAVAVQVTLSLRGVVFGSLDFQSFAETVYQFRITPDLVVQGVVFSVVIGFFGSLLPALRAARLPVISALKSL